MGLHSFVRSSSQPAPLLCWLSLGLGLCWAPALLVMVVWAARAQVQPRAGAGPGQPTCIWHFSAGSSQLDITSRGKPEGSEDLPTGRYLSKAWCRCFEPRVQQSVTIERLLKLHCWKSWRQKKTLSWLGTEQCTTGVSPKIPFLWHYDEGRKRACHRCLQIQR